MATPRVIVSLPAKEAMQAVSQGIETKLARAFNEYAKSMASDVSKKHKLRKMHRDVAEGAKNAVVSAYSSKTRRPSYRQAGRGSLRRYSGKALLRALKSDSFVRSSDKGIAFGDMDLLDRQAAQWYRLNFGTEGQVNTPSYPTGSMRFGFGNRYSPFRLSLDAYKPSASFNVPMRGRGMWSKDFKPSTSGSAISAETRGIGRDALYVGRSIVVKKGTSTKANPFFRSVESRGIKGERFLDRGARYINENYPRQLTQLVKNAERKAKERAKAAARS